MPSQQVDHGRVEAYLLERFLNLGFKPDQAETLVLFDVDWHDAERLLDRGCSHLLVLRILT